MKAALVSSALLVTILAMPVGAQAHDRHEGHFFGVHDRYAYHDCHGGRHGHHGRHRHGHGRHHDGHHGWTHAYGRPAPWYAYQLHHGYREFDRRWDGHRNDWDRRH